MTTDNKRFIYTAKDNRTTEVTENLWNAFVSRSDMDRYTIESVLSPSEGVYCKLWVNSKVYDLGSFDELVECLVRNLYMGLGLAKDFAHKINSAGEHKYQILLGRF